MQSRTPDLGEVNAETLNLLKALAVDEGKIPDPAVDADDIAQEAAVVVWQRGKEEAVGIGLAVTVVRRRRTDAYRRRRPTTSLAVMEENEEAEWPARATVPGPEAATIDRMLTGQLLRRLGSTTRALVAMDALGYRGRELGIRYRLSEANVHQRLSRARRDLRRGWHGVR